MKKKLLSIVKSSTKISFYNELYSQQIHDFNNKKLKIIFSDIPVISKKDIFNSNIQDPDAEIAFTRATSGTSGEMAIFKRSRTDRIAHFNNFKYQANYYLKKNMKCFILFPPDLSFIFGNYFSNFGCPVIFGDITNLKATVALFKKIKPQIIRTVPSYAYKLGEFLNYSEASLLTKKIILSGSVLSKLTFKKLNTFFPNAKIIQNYGLAETGVIGWQCPELFGSNHYHLFDNSYYFEIMDEKSKNTKIYEKNIKLSTDLEGELLITSLIEKTGNRLIRYKTGDIVTLLKNKKCSCGFNNGTIKIIGRKKFDIIKLKGITIYKDSFEKSLLSLPYNVKPNYVINIYEKKTKYGIQPYLIIDIEINSNKNISNKIKDEENCIAKKIMENFMITQDYSWTDAVNKDFFLPIEIKIRKNLLKENFKLKNIIDHRI